MRRIGEGIGRIYVREREFWLKPKEIQSGFRCQFQITAQAIGCGKPLQGPDVAGLSVERQLAMAHRLIQFSDQQVLQGYVGMNYRDGKVIRVKPENRLLAFEGLVKITCETTGAAIEMMRRGGAWVEGQRFAQGLFGQVMASAGPEYCDAMKRQGEPVRTIGGHRLARGFQHRIECRRRI